MNSDQLRQIMSDIAHKEIPANTDIWMKIRQQIDPPMLPKARLQQSALRLGFAAISALVLAGLLWMMRPMTVSAAEILSRSAAVQANIETAGIHSFTGRILSRQPYYFDYQTMPHENKYESYVWFASPDKQRVEIYAYINPHKEGAHLPGEALRIKIPNLHSTATEPDKTFLFTVQAFRNGISSYFDPVKHVVNILEDNPTNSAKALPDFLNRTNAYGGVDTITGSVDIQSILEHASRDFEAVQLLGESTIADRAAYVIKLINKPQSADGSSDAKLARQITLWIDKQFYLQLGIEIMDGENKLLWVSRYEKLNINPTIDSDIFALKLPDTVKTNRIKAQEVPSADELAASWQAIANKLKYTKVFAPTSIPNSLTALAPVYYDHLIEQSFRLNTGGYITLIQGGIAANYISSGKYEGVPIKIGSNDGYLLDWGQQRILAWELQWTPIVVIGHPGTSLDLMLEIAASLKLIPRTPPTSTPSK